MRSITGIKYRKGKNGNSYVYIDLDMYRDNQLLKDFLDMIEIESRKNKKLISIEKFNRSIDIKVKMDAKS